MDNNQFRKIALALPGAVEGAHMGHPDFRVKGKVFASLFWSKGADWGMVKLTPAQQRELVKARPGVVMPCAGAWGAGGATQARLGDADVKTMRGAIEAAWRNLAPAGGGEEAHVNARGGRAMGVGVHVAMLRGINVGGKNTLPMKDLSAMFGEAGCADVRTYIASGNVVFGATAAVVKRLPAAISKMIEERMGLRVPVVVRSGAELNVAAKGNPFLREGEDEAFCHVGFLSDVPGKACVSALDAERSPGDRFALRGREIYLHLPNGVAKSKLTNAYFDSTLKTVSTFRNWRTVTKLMDMAREIG